MSALVAQLRGVEPALSESDITKERLALEEAIRKVEAEAARKAITEPKGSARTEPRFATALAARRGPAEPSLSLPRVDVERADSEQLEVHGAEPDPASAHVAARTSPALEEIPRGRKTSADVLGAAIAKAAQTARDTHDSYEPFHGRESRGPTTTTLRCLPRNSGRSRSSRMTCGRWTTIRWK